MKWFSFQYVKRNPWLFVGIVVIFGVLFWLLMNKGGSSSTSGGTTVVTGGMSDAEAAANLQLGLATMGAQTQLAIASQQSQARMVELDTQSKTTLALAGLEAQYRFAELGASKELAELQTTADLTALDRQLNYQLAAQTNQNAFTVDYAALAYDAATEQVRINAALQSEMGKQQMEVFKTSSLLSLIPSLKKKNRDEALIAIGSAVSGQPIAYTPERGGGFNPLRIMSPITNIL